MGGNIFSNTERITASNYNNAVNDLILYHFPQATVIPSYAHKADFGDIDLLIEDTYFDKSSKNFSVNGNVYSFPFEYMEGHFVQVDVIVVPEEEFFSAYHYYAYNDLGNLLGRIAHKLGMKYSHRGLSIVLRDESDVLGEVLLTNDYKRILDILGLRPPPYFFSMEDIFKYVCSSKYFSPEIFLLENRNGKGSRRDSKRKTYNMFLEYIKDMPSGFEYDNPSEIGGHSIREPFYTDIVLKEFPCVKEYVDNLFEEHAINKEFKKICNGSIVSEQTGLVGVELGNFMKMLKVHVAPLEVKKFLLRVPLGVRLLIEKVELDYKADKAYNRFLQ